MITIANAFIFVLLVGAAFLGVSAVVEKKSVQRRRTDERSTNAAA